jgi:hypothetical protein
MRALVLRLAGGSARKWPLRHRFVVAALLAICATALGTASAKAAGQVSLAPPPDNTSPPTISGNAVEGETLTGTNGTWDGDELTFTRNWQRSDGLGGYDDIPGATATTYTLTSADVGHTIRLRVTASNTNRSETAFSAPTGTVTAPPPEPPDNLVPPTISGNAVEGQTLTSTDGSWDGEELTFERQWQRSNGGGYVDISGATGTTYTLTSADVGHTIRLSVTASNASDSETATSAPTDPVAAAQNVERSLGLFVPQRPQAYKRATIRVQGIAVPPLRLWVYENLRGEACPATPAERKRRSRAVIEGLPVEGDFNEQRRPRMKKPGRHAYCAYLGPDEGTATITSFTTRKVRKPLLRAGRARGTVVTALRRHNFANRVIENLQQSCGRRSRSEFECRFSSAFPGYSLTGRGSVELKRQVSYRFQVSVHGRSLALTDENEGSFPG